MDTKFNLVSIHNQLFKKQFNSSERHLTEFHIITALKDSSKTNTLKRVFSILYLIDKAEGKYTFEPTTIISIVLMLVHDSDAQVRAAALKLADVISQQSAGSKEVLDVFIRTEKPKSTKKNMDKKAHTPMKAQSANSFLEELMRHKAEIEQD